MIFDLLVTSVYVPTSVGSTTTRFFPVGNTLIWKQNVAKNIRTRRSGSNFVMSQSAVVDRSITVRSIQQTFNIQHIANKAAKSFTVNHGLIMWHQAWRNRFQAVSQPFVYTQSLAGNGSKGTKATSVYTQTIRLSVVRNISVSSIFVPVGSAAITTTLGSGFIMPVNVPPAVQPLVRFTFGSFTFQVHRPEFDNSRNFEFSRISRRSRAGDLIIYRDGMWPSSITLKMEFKLLKEIEKNYFKTLFRLSLGQLIRYDDYQGQSWSGIILNPGEPIVQYGIGDRYSTKIELQGGTI